MDKLLKAFIRTKRYTTAEVDETKLRRCLTTFDLTALGVGTTLGAGVYVVTGEVARNQAGPAITISFAIAAVASLLSGLCYAEFSARVPKAGSAYVYSYVTIGELCAFAIGWNMILEYVVAAAAVAKAWSDFLNSLCNDCTRDIFRKHLWSWKSGLISGHADILAFMLICIFTIVIICGAAQSSLINWVFTILNLSVILFGTAAGLVYANLENWSNFTPFGFRGVMAGAATCFFAFVGFETIASTGEETTSPRKSIPRALVATLVIVFIAYECISVTLTLMMPYNKLPKSSALATAFDHKGFPAAKYIVAVGAICGLSSSVLGALFTVPRTLYAMASDGLIFSFFAKVNERTGTPVISCAVGGLLCGLLAMFLDLVALTQMLSIGTLFSFTIVSISVILLRYKPGSVTDDTACESDCVNEEISADLGLEEDTEIAKEFHGVHSNPSDFVMKSEKRLENIGGKENTTDLFSANEDFSNAPSILRRIRSRIVGHPLDSPTEDSFLVVKISLGMFILHTIVLECCLVWGLERLASKDPLLIICVVFFLMWILVAIDTITRQPESRTDKLAFRVPLLPFLPLAAIFINIVLLLELSYLTWIRFAVWLVLGMVIYLFYGIKHSTENQNIITKSGGASYVELSTATED